MTSTLRFESVVSAPTRALGPVLLIGGGGLLGRAWRRLLDRHDIECTPVDRAALDLTVPDSIEQAVTRQFPLVINCAGWTDVDGAESRVDEAMAVNALGVRNLARRCGRVGAMLVQHSTDYVFNGRSATPYEVDSPPDPINAYGRTQWMGELFVQQSGCRHLLIRTSWLYAPWGGNFVRTIARLARVRPTLQVVDDQRGRPTSSEHLARTTLRLLAAGATGMYHVCDGDEATRFDFAKAVAAWADPACRVEPCTSAAFPRPARRPAYSVLALTRVESELGAMPDWRTNLADVLSRMDP